MVAVLSVALGGWVAAPPPVAAGTTGAVADGDGVDFDAACLKDDKPAGLPPLANPRAPNAIASPAGTGCGTGAGTRYDGSTESTDLRSFSLEGLANGRPKATCDVDRDIPAAGGAVRADADLPDDALFVGFSCRVLYQVPRKQDLVPNPDTGCERVEGGGGRLFDVQGHHKDGFHNFLGYEVRWDGAKWIHSAQVGWYDPAPDGGFRVIELGIAGSSVAGSPRSRTR